MALVLVVVLSSFALSFTVLRDLAALSGIPEGVAWLWPVIVDGTITAATVVLYTSRGAHRRPVMPLVTLVLFAAASVVGNVAHILLFVNDPVVAKDPVVPVPIAVFVAIAPPLGLIMTVEILGSLLRTADEVVADDPVAVETAQHDAPIVVVGPAAHEPVVAREEIQSVEPVAPAGEPAVWPVDPAPHHAQMTQVVGEPSLDDDVPLVVGAVEIPKADTDAPAIHAPLTTAGPEARVPEPATATNSESESETVDAPAAQSKGVPTAKVDRAEVVAQARKLIEAGDSMRAATEQLRVSRASLSRWLKAADEVG